jgi:hypothetical protein
MHTKFLLFPLLFLVCAATLISTGKYAESRALFREAMAEGAGIVRLMESQDLEVVKVDMDLVNTAVNKQTLKVLSTDFTYFITAVGQPSRIEDLDIALYYLNDGNATLVDKDQEADNSPVIKFKPYVAGTYVIQIIAAKMKKGYEQSMGFYFLTIAHD